MFFHTKTGEWIKFIGCNRKTKITNNWNESKHKKLKEWTKKSIGWIWYFGSWQLKKRKIHKWKRTSNNLIEW